MLAEPLRNLIRRGTPQWVYPEEGSFGKSFSREVAQPLLAVQGKLTGRSACVTPSPWKYEIWMSRISPAG